MKDIFIAVYLLACIISSNAFVFHNNRLLSKRLVLKATSENDNFEPIMVITPNNSRRNFLETTAGTIPILVNPLIADPSFAATQSFDTYTDDECGFQVQVPSMWIKTVQELPDRRKIVLFVDPNSGEEDKNLFFIAYTPVRDDFTQLSSFGSVDQVAQMTILPKSRIMGDETENEMLTAESKKNAYYFDYSSKSPGQPKRHFRTIFSLVQGATGGAGAVLVTLTAQTMESRYNDFKETYDNIIDSYGKLKR